MKNETLTLTILRMTRPLYNRMLGIKCGMDGILWSSINLETVYV